MVKPRALPSTNSPKLTTLLPPGHCPLGPDAPQEPPGAQLLPQTPRLLGCSALPNLTWGPCSGEPFPSNPCRTCAVPAPCLRWLGSVSHLLPCGYRASRAWWQGGGTQACAQGEGCLSTLLPPPPGPIPLSRVFSPRCTTGPAVPHPTPKRGPPNPGPCTAVTPSTHPCPHPSYAVTP